MKASFKRYILKFKRPGGTSRGVLNEKESWFIKLEADGKTGVGECGILRGLSIDDRPDYEEKLQWLVDHIHLDKNQLLKELREFPSIQFGLEMALQSLHAEDPFILFPSEFTKGKKEIPINGLIWMGDPDFMKEQIDRKLAEGFSCIKLKIGAIDFNKELELLNFIRKEFPADKIQIRVDANGAFSPETAFEKLKTLSQFDLHSIEQPIKQGQFDEMKKLCKTTPLPIALDEELIGIFDRKDKKELLQKIVPQFIILKPSLVGGFKGTQEWIDLAENLNIGWWITSALESNIGLNAIAQWTALKNTDMPQGLGTGSLYTNNFSSPLVVSGEDLTYQPKLEWNVNNLKF